MQMLTYDSAPAHTLLLTLADNGQGEFVGRNAAVVTEDSVSAQSFIASLPAAANRRIFTRTRTDGNVVVSTYVRTPTGSALAGFNRFIKHAIASGYTPAASTSDESRNKVSIQPTVEDIEMAYADLIPKGCHDEHQPDVPRHRHDADLRSLCGS